MRHPIIDERRRTKDEIGAGASRVIFPAGDDAKAKHMVADLIEQISFAPLDTGSLRESVRQEPDMPIYNKDLTLAEARVLLSRNT